MNTEEDNSRQGKSNTPTQEAELVVELNSEIMKTIQSLQADLHSFRDDNLNDGRNPAGETHSFYKQVQEGAWS